MDYTEISYRRVKNLGNYESETLELTALLHPGENIDSAYNCLKHKAKYLLNIEPFKHDESKEDDLIF